MVRTRRGPALFEVISKQSSGLRRPPRLGVPDWWRRRASSERASETEGEATDLPIEPTEQAAVQQEARGTESSGAGEEAGGEAWLSVREGRVRLVLSPVAGVIVVGAALLVVLGGFSVGRSMGWRDARRALVEAGDSVAAVRQAEPDPSVLLAMARGGGSSPGPADASIVDEIGGAGELEVGKTYLVIQTFAPSARADAVRAQRFLATKDVPTVLRQVSNGYLLVAREAFDWDNPQERSKFESFRRSMVALGQLYASDAYRGGYDFKDCYPSTYRG